MLAAITSSGHAADPTASAVRAAISRDGARAVVQRFTQAHQFDRIVDLIGTGAPAWVRLAPLLAPGTDGATGEGLGIALAYALPRNAAAVLKVVSTAPYPPTDAVDIVLSIDRVCSVPFIEPPPGANERYRNRAIAALDTVRDPRLLDRRRRCLRTLRAND